MRKKIISEIEVKHRLDEKYRKLWDIYSARYTPSLRGNHLIWDYEVYDNFCKIHKLKGE